MPLYCFRRPSHKGHDYDPFLALDDAQDVLHRGSERKQPQSQVSTRGSGQNGNSRRGISHPTPPLLPLAPGKALAWRT